MPVTAAERSPTGEKTENLPPTFWGISNVLYPSSFAMAFKLPFSGSVVAITCSEYDSPYTFLSMSLTIINCDMVSAVPPDLVITLKRVFFKSITSKRELNTSGSTLSITNILGRFLFSLERNPLKGWLSAVLRAIFPRAEPPIPRTTKFSYLSAIESANFWISSALSVA